MRTKFRKRECLKPISCPTTKLCCLVCRTNCKAATTELTMYSNLFFVQLLVSGRGIGIHKSSFSFIVHAHRVKLHSLLQKPYPWGHWAVTLESGHAILNGFLHYARASYLRVCISRSRPISWLLHRNRWSLKRLKWGNVERLRWMWCLDR